MDLEISFEEVTRPLKFHTLFCCFHCWLWVDFTHCFVVSIVDFKQINDGWEIFLDNSSQK